MLTHPWAAAVAKQGAGYAGGIVSAAVDGLKVGEAIVRQLLGDDAVMAGAAAGSSSQRGGAAVMMGGY